MRALSLVFVSSTAAATPAILPPVEVGVGKAAVSSAHDSYTATQVTVGLSLASLLPTRTPVDVGLGWIGDYGEDGEDPTTDRHASGVYASVALRSVEGTHWRAWFGMRGELVYTDTRGLLGLAARGSIELWRGVDWHDHDGGLHGSLGLTVFIEAIAREERTRLVVAGIGGRLPMFAAR